MTSPKNILEILLKGLEGKASMYVFALIVLFGMYKITTSLMNQAFIKVDSLALEVKQANENLQKIDRTVEKFVYTLDNHEKRINSLETERLLRNKNK
jgi:hypothetical protein